MNRYALVAHGMRMLLPFSEKIAVRMLVLAAASFVGLATYLVLARRRRRRRSADRRHPGAGHRPGRAVPRRVHRVRRAVLRLQPGVGDRHEGRDVPVAVARAGAVEVTRRRRPDGRTSSDGGARGRPRASPAGALGCSSASCSCRSSRRRAGPAARVVPDRRLGAALHPGPRRRSPSHHPLLGSWTSASLQRRRAHEQPRRRSTTTSSPRRRPDCSRFSSAAAIGVGAGQRGSPSIGIAAGVARRSAAGRCSAGCCVGLRRADVDHGQRAAHRHLAGPRPAAAVPRLPRADGRAGRRPGPLAAVGRRRGDRCSCRRTSATSSSSPS